MLRKVLILLSLMLLMLSNITCVSAFPLTGGNGIVNATVYGVTEKESVNGDGIIYYIDMSADEDDIYSIVLVDSEDIAHGNSQTSDGSPNFMADSGSKYDITHIYNGSFRDTLKIPVPEGTVIKRLKITPRSSDPFSIDWDGVPEVSAEGVKLQFYSGKSEYTGEGKSTWVFDLKVTNLGNDTITLPSFFLMDTTGWGYGGTNARDKLLSSESLRFLVTFRDIGASSRPSTLIFNMKPPVTFENAEELQSNVYEDATMDIGAWA